MAENDKVVQLSAEIIDRDNFNAIADFEFQELLGSEYGITVSKFFRIYNKLKNIIPSGSLNIALNIEGVSTFSELIERLRYIGENYATESAHLIYESLNDLIGNVTLTDTFKIGVGDQETHAYLVSSSFPLTGGDANEQCKLVLTTLTELFYKSARLTNQLNDVSHSLDLALNDNDLLRMQLNKIIPNGFQVTDDQLVLITYDEPDSKEITFSGGTEPYAIERIDNSNDSPPNIQVIKTNYPNQPPIIITQGDIAGKFASGDLTYRNTWTISAMPGISSDSVIRWYDSSGPINTSNIVEPGVEYAASELVYVKGYSVADITPIISSMGDTIVVPILTSDRRVIKKTLTLTGGLGNGGKYGINSVFLETKTSHSDTLWYPISYKSLPSPTEPDADFIKYWQGDIYNFYIDPKSPDILVYTYESGISEMFVGNTIGVIIRDIQLDKYKYGQATLYFRSIIGTP